MYFAECFVFRNFRLFLHRCEPHVRPWLLDMRHAFTGVPARCVVLLVRCPGPLGSCSPVCPLGVLFCLCGVLGHLAPVHRCARSVCCVTCAVSWATWLLFSGAPAGCVVVCAESWATWLLFTGAPARCAALRVRCPWPLGFLFTGVDLNITMIRPLDGLQLSEYLKEFGDIYKRLEKRLEPLLVNQDQWKRDKSYLWHEDRIPVPSDRVPALLKWTHESSGHVGADRTLRLFKQWFHTTWTDDQLRKTLQPIVDKCPCRSCKPGDIRDRGLYSTLPIPHCANSVLYVDYTEMPKFGGYDLALVVTCGLTRFTRVFPCTKHITGEETIKILLEEWFCVYGAPKEINSDEDVRVRSDTSWYKRVLRSLNVQVSTGIPYSHTSNPLCERQIRVLKENVRIWCKTERTRDWVRLLTVISLMMNSQESSATGYSPHELFLGRPAWFLHAPYPEDTHSSVGEWVQEQQAKVDKAKAMLQRVRERQWNKKNKHRVPATYQDGDWVLVHHSRLPALPRSTSDDPYFGPYKILSVDGHGITLRCSPRLGGTLVCAAQHLKRYYDPEDLCGEEWELNDEEIAALDLHEAASPMEVEGELPDMNAEEMAKEGFYLLKSVLRHRYRQGWRFLTLWEGFGVEEATWEPFSAFVLPEGRLNSVLVDYLSQNNLGGLLRLAETLASKTKATD